jgi:hypothetical protein
MNRTTKILALTAVVAVAGTVGWQALAQMPMGNAHGPGMNMRSGMAMGMSGGHGPMAGGLADPTARLADLKTELGITALQQPAWDDYAKVLADAVAAMKTQHEGMDMSAMRSLSDQDRQARMTQMRDQHAAVTAAAEKVLAALDDAQKAKAREVLPGLAEHGPGAMRHAGMGAHGARHGKGTH